MASGRTRHARRGHRRGASGLTTAKHTIEAGFDVTVFEASDDLGGQWHRTAAHSRHLAGHTHEHQPRDRIALRDRTARDQGDTEDDHQFQSEHGIIFADVRRS